MQRLLQCHPNSSFHSDISVRQLSIRYDNGLLLRFGGLKISYPLYHPHQGADLLSRGIFKKLSIDKRKVIETEEVMAKCGRVRISRIVKKY